MYVIYKTTEEQDYGYGGWKDTCTKYFEIIAVTSDEDKAKKFVSEKSKDGDYDYEWAEEI